MSKVFAKLFAPLLDKLPPWTQTLSPRVHRALAFIAVLGLIATLGYPYASGKIELEQQRLNRLLSEISSTNAEITDTRREYDFVINNIPRYEQALERNILSPQDRLAARHMLDDLYYRHHLVSLNYEFSQANFLPAGNTHEVVSTPIVLQVGAMLDRDIMSMLRTLERSLPGYPVFRSITLKGIDTIQEADLVAIRAGTPVAFFQGEIRLEWRTARSVQGSARSVEVVVEGGDDDDE